MILACYIGPEPSSTLVSLVVVAIGIAIIVFGRKIVRVR